MKFESQKRSGANLSETCTDVGNFENAAQQRARTARRAYWHLAQGTHAARHGRSSRRKGQALLLAVLLMVFAALLGSTFVTVVALNMNQSARDKNKTDAKLAAQAGLKVINDQINSSREGENWRPEMVSPPPDSTDPTYNAYYTPFERAQGWALGYKYSNGAATPDEDKWQELKDYKDSGGRVFVKSPDPRSFSSDNSPSFLAEVTKLVNNPDPKKDGLLQITVIGRSLDNDIVFARNTAYKATISNGSPFSYASYTGNYDYRAGRPLNSKIVSITPNVDKATIALQEGLNIEPGRTLMLWQGTNTASVITTAVSPDGRTIEVTAIGTPNYGVFTPGAEIRAAATLMDSLLTVDEDGAGTSGTTVLESRDLLASQGVFVGGAARVSQKLNLTNQDTVKNVVTVAGPIQVSTTATAEVKGAAWTSTTTPPQVQADISTEYSNSSANLLKPPSLDDNGGARYRRLASNDWRGSSYGYGRGVYIDNTKDFEKVVTTSGGYRNLQDFELYRLLQRKSFPKAANDAAANADIIGLTPEKGTTVHSLAYPRKLPASGSYYPVTGGQGSLEEYGLRGWISPNEYRARGVQIELRGDTIIIQRDRLSDMSATNPDPAIDDPANVWRLPDGTPVTGTSDNYRMKLVVNTGPNTVTRSYGAPGDDNYLSTTSASNDGGFNGVIFAEGNVRIRGYLGSKDITVVSMGNIYIDGSIIRDQANPDNPGTGAKRIALMARRNVILNPTGVFPSVPMNYTEVRMMNNPIAVSSDTAANAGSIDLTNGAQLRDGDMLRIEGAGNQLYRVVGNPAGTTVTIAPNLVRDVEGGGAVTVRMAGSKLGSNAKFVYEGGERFYDIGTGENAKKHLAGASSLVRDLKLDGANPTLDPGSAPYFLNVLQSGQYKRAATLTLVTPGTAAPPIPVYTHQEVGSPDGLIGLAEKLIEAPSATAGDRAFSYSLVDFNPGGPVRGSDRAQNLEDFIFTFDFEQKIPNPFPNPSDPTTFDIIYWNMESSLSSSPKAYAVRRLAKMGPLNALENEPIDLISATAAGIYYGVDPMQTGVPAPTFHIGSAFNWASVSNDPFPAAGTPEEANPLLQDDAATTANSFYERRTILAPTVPAQQVLKWSNFNALAAPAYLPNAANDMGNPIVITGETALNLPNYRVGDVRIERDNFSSTGNFAPVRVRVQAAIFAQYGSWFVVPAPLSALYDADSNEVAGDSAADKAAGTRYRRLNYLIDFRGTIAQNAAPSPNIDYDNELDPDLESTGAVAKWLDTTSFPANKIDAGGGAIRGENWRAIKYITDPIPDGTKLVLPVSPDLIYSSS